MLLIEDLSFYRGQSGFTSMGNKKPIGNKIHMVLFSYTDMLIEQEETYVALLVQRILRYSPKVLICHGTIDLSAQNQLRYIINNNRNM